MSLLHEHKAERRARIGKAARQLVVERGYEGLTMRELAQKARVAVPTLYNLFGSKDAILVAELEASARVIASQLPTGGDSFFARGLESLLRYSPPRQRIVPLFARTRVRCKESFEADDIVAIERIDE